MDVLVEPAPSSRYKAVSEVKAGGATYTPKILADFVATQMLRTVRIKPSGGTVKLLDPATGDGELLLSLLEQLDSCGDCAIEVHGFETDADALNLATVRIKQRFPKIALNLTHGNFLDYVLKQARPHDVGGLFEAEGIAPSFDLIIANPPPTFAPKSWVQSKLNCLPVSLGSRAGLIFTTPSLLAWHTPSSQVELVESSFRIAL
jgi:adenine-specific DNA-methyltransferase